MTKHNGDRSVPRGLRQEAVVLRDMTGTDIDAIVAVEQASYPEPWGREEFDWLFSLKRSRGMVAEACGRVIGFLLYDRYRRKLYISNIAVIPAYRGRGIGRALIERLSRTLSLDGVHRLELDVRKSNTRAQRLYLELGFTVDRVKPGYYEDGEDSVYMQYRLARTKS